MNNKCAYILIGDNNTGKTTFQKEIAFLLTGQQYERLDCNKDLVITNKACLQRHKRLFIMNRSFQEKIADYITVKDYFNNNFKENDICILSSHLEKQVIEEMITELKQRFYNIIGVFFTNSISNNLQANKEISMLDLQERLIICNDSNINNWSSQLRLEANELSYIIMNK